MALSQPKAAASFPLGIGNPAEEPPAYNSSPYPDPSEILPPCRLVLHGRFIYPLLSSGEPDSEPLYQLSRAIHVLTRATDTIDFARLDFRVRPSTSADDGGPSVSKRAKDVYVLRHQNRLLYAGIPFSARLLPQSRKTVGEVSIEKSPVFRHGYRAMSVVSEEERVAVERKGGKVKTGEYHFVMREEKSGMWLWKDPAGALVAKQKREKPVVEGGEAVYSLEVLVPLSRRLRDALVALWCLWMWHIHIEESTPRKTWEDREYLFVD